MRAQSVMVPFPSKLMSTARSPALMPLSFAREVRNLLAGPAGTGVKRNGVSVFGSALPGGVSINGIFGFVHDGVVQTIASASDGSLRLKTLTGWTVLKSGMSVDGVVRCAAFAGKLVFCNGCDDMLVWDGVTLATIEEMVVDKSTGLTYLTANSFKIDSEAALYAVGTKVRARLGGVNYVQGVVASVAQSGAHTTVTLTANVLTSALDQMAYAARPPRAAFVYAAHDRLWALGMGPLKASGLGTSVDRMRVFYTFGVNDPAAWHDADGNWQSINLADKSPVQDELLAMSVKDNMTVFFGRRQTQVWTGSDPTLEGDFGWDKTLPLGVVHGEAVFELPNDVAFLSENGLRTLSRSLKTEQLDVSDVGGEIDPTWMDYITGLKQDDAVYRKLRRGQQEAQGWFVLRGVGASVVLQVTAGGPAWSLFDGYFADADALGNLPDGTLLLARGGQLYRYDTGVWDDAGTSFVCRWWTPWMAPAGSSRRWGNYTLEVLTSRSVTVPLTLSRYVDMDEGNPLKVNLESEGAPDWWDTANWDAALWDNATPVAARVRDHFVADWVSLALEHEGSAGPLVILGLKLEGVSER